MIRSALRLPVLLRFPPEAAREAAWGWVSELTPGSARLETQAPLAAGERVLASFALAGEDFSDVGASVRECDEDEDGYFCATFDWRDELQRRRLARLLLDVIASAPDAD